MKINLWKHGYVRTIEDKIGCGYDEINSNDETRINAITSIAAISRGKDKSNNPIKRFQHLLKEAAPDVRVEDVYKQDIYIENKAGRPLEFCPIKVEITNNKNNNSLLLSLFDDHFAFISEQDKYTLLRHSILTYEYGSNFLWTNLRALYNVIGDNSLGFYNRKEDFNSDPYFIVEVKAPYFVFAQIRTHGQLSQIAVSERVVKEDEYWLPNDICERLLSSNYGNIKVFSIDKLKNNDIEHVVDIFLNKLTVPQIQNLLHIIGYKKEICNRWPNHMKYKTWIMGGYINDPKQWGHFLLEREAYPELYKSWVQKETHETAYEIRQLIESYYNLNKEK